MEKSTNKLKLFLENFIVYGLGGVISRVIPIIMLPIVTRLLPDRSYFGISDMSTTVVSFCGAFAVMGMYDAMYRLFFEKEELNYRKLVCSTAVTFCVFTSVTVVLAMILVKGFIARYFFGDEKYDYLVYISAAATLVQATNSMLSAPTRMQNKRKIYLTANTLGPIISYGISIPLILRGYYIIALPIAALTSAAIVEISFFLLNRKWFDLRLFDRNLLKQLLAIGFPLLPNFLVYWVFNSSDRLMITNMIDIGAEGVYSVGSKLGHVSHLIYTAFAGGWQYFAFSTMKERDQVGTNSKVFEYLGIISFITSFFVFALSKTIFRLLFSAEYHEGYIVAPYLYMAPLMQMLFQVIGNQFLVVKKTWPNMFILLCGAVLNLVLNLVLIPAIGIEGAAIATLVGFVCATVVCSIVLCRMKLMVISGKFLISCGITVVFILLWRLMLFNKTGLSLLAAIVASGSICLQYKGEIAVLYRRLLVLVGRHQ